MWRRLFGCEIPHVSNGCDAFSFRVLKTKKQNLGMTDPEEVTANYTPTGTEPRASRHKFSVTIQQALTHLLTYLLHGAGSFLRSYLVCSWSRNSPRFMEPEGSSPHSQASATCPYPEPSQSSSHILIPPPEGPS